MGYLGELRENARPLASAAIGMGSGLSFFAYMSSVFGPYLVEEFHWPRSLFALVGLSMFVSLLALPFVGRFTDRFGVKRMAIFGTVTMPLCLIAFSRQTGQFWMYLVIGGLLMIVGAATSPIVYTRLVAERFARAQGLALTIVTSAPALSGAALAPVVNAINERYGWRNGYLAVAAFVFVANVIAVLLIPRGPAAERGQGAAPVKASRPARQDFKMILRSRTLWIILVAVMFCMLPTPIYSSQLNLMLLDQGLDKAQAAMAVSVFAVGTIVGRIGCGLALDRFATHLVAALSMFVPVIGFFVLALPIDAVGVIVTAIFAVGFAVGAENDLVSYLVAKYFRLEIFSSTLSLVFVGSFFASAVGAVAISATLKHFDSFTPFLYLVSVTGAVGSLMFLLLPRNGRYVKVGEDQLASLQVTGLIEPLPA